MENTPRAMEEYRKYLDQGITLHKDKAIINLDYNKIFRRRNLEGQFETTEMTLFQSLSDSPLKVCYSGFCFRRLSETFHKGVEVNKINNN